MTQIIRGLRNSEKNAIQWHDIKIILGENLGFWDNVLLSEKDEKLLKDCYLNIFWGGELGMVKNLYSKDKPIAELAVNILKRMAALNWASG